MKKFNFKSRKGFTLIELLVVIGILAVLAAIAIPSVAGLIDRANVSADDTNANEMTNAIERFTSEYELVCQDIASGRFDLNDLDSAQSRIYNSTGIKDRDGIKELETGLNGLAGKKINKDTKYPENELTFKSIIENYTKTSSATYEPKQSDKIYWYSPDCGVVVVDTPDATKTSLNGQILSGKDAKGKVLDENTVWINISAENSSLDNNTQEDIFTNYTASEIANNPLLFAIGGTQPEYVVAEFTSDFSSVTISKNGENSDGIMKDWDDNLSSPHVSETNVKSVVIASGVKNIGYGTFACTNTIQSVTIANTVETINTAAFYECLGLTTINIPSSVKTIGDEAFAYSSDLKTVTLNEGLLTIGELAFSYCENLTNISLPNTLTSIGRDAFFGCSSLKTINIPAKVSSIGQTAFGYCTSLTSIDVNTNNTNYSSVDGVLFNKNQTKLIQYPNGKTNSEYIMPNTVVEIESFAFEFSSNISNIVLSNSLKTTGQRSFGQCVNLTSIVLPEGFTTLGNSCFYCCDKLANITLPISITNIETNAFMGCPVTLKLHGQANSYVETWANEHGYTFVAQ